MKTDFLVVSAVTVPANYTWDLGTPLDTAQTFKRVITTTSYVSGYAPAVRVLFFNNSVPDPDYDRTTYEWNFGDYYNDTHNILSLSCVSNVEHLFIMPGTYTVSLRQKQAKSDEVFVGSADYCLGKYGIRWFWNEMIELDITWNETMCPALPETPVNRRYSKWWADETACFAKYCRYWQWEALKQESLINPVRWSETESSAVFEKQWAFEDNETICSVTDADFLTTQDVVDETVTKTYTVEVVELPPVAELRVESRDVKGSSPLTVQLTPRFCSAGSFPIDRIDWDLGDGTPPFSVTRFSTLTGDRFLYTGNFFVDPADPRNYDIVHTYKRTIKTYSVFYPSLTCYSSNTGTYDIVATTIGPLTLPATPVEIELINVRNTDIGNIYAINSDSGLGFLTNSVTVSTTPASINVPTTTKLRNPKQEIYQFYAGNPGFNFPPDYDPECFVFSRGILDIEKFLTTDDDNPFDAATDSLTAESVSGVPIFTLEGQLLAVD